MIPFLFLVLSLVFSSEVTLAGTVRYKNKMREQRERERVEKEIEKIPLHREKLKGDYTMLGIVRASDALTKNKTAIVKNLRLQAHKVKADAIMEFQCQELKNIIRTCEGIAIKY